MKKRSGCATAAVAVCCLFGLPSFAGAEDAERLALVEEGRPVSAIVVPGTPTPVVRYAAEELAYHVRKATGAELPVVSENDFPGGHGAVFLGPTRRALAAGIDPAALEPNGFVIRRDGPDLLMVGHDSDGEPLGGYANRTRAGTLFAVYEFLETHLGVRWLWPGPLGEFIPAQSTIAVGAWDQVEGYPYLWAHLRVSPGRGLDGWSSTEARDAFIRVQDTWLKRQRFSQLSDIRPGHDFEDWWNRWGATHPELFARLPDGERRPLDGDARGIRISMCISQPAFWDRIVAHWVESRRASYNGVIKIGENDTPGLCTCDGCRAWDAPDPRFAASDYWSGRVDASALTTAHRFGTDGQAIGVAGDGAPSLADRYARFYLAVQRRAEEVNPEARVTGLAYANYLEPPREVRLNERVSISIVPGFYFPWTEAKRAAALAQWQGWHATGARLMLRPNYMLSGHNLPVMYARELGEDVGYALRHGAIGTDFDSLVGSWGTQGPTLYILGRIHVRPDLPVETLLAEYYAAFGPAEAEVRAYFAHWERVSRAVTDELMDAIVREAGDAGGYARFIEVAPFIFTPEIMAEGRALLTAARATAAIDAMALARVNYLDKGLRHAELTLAAQAAHVAYHAAPDTPRIEAYRQALRTLEQFRHSVEGDHINHMGYITAFESRIWDRALARMDELGALLPEAWRLQWDPDNRGVAGRWYLPGHDASGWQATGVDAHWKDQPPGRAYRAEHGHDYEGVAWYRNTFNVEGEAGPGARVVLAFGAVDAACTVWVNGVEVLDRPFPYRGSADSWMQPFEVDVTDAVRAGQPNTLVVRVDHVSGPGGIWKPVRMILRHLDPVDMEANRIENPTFEPGAPGWRHLPHSGEAVFSYDPTHPLYGTHAALVRAARATGRLTQRIAPVEPGRDYRMRLWLRTSPEFTGRITANLDGHKASMGNTAALWRALEIARIPARREHLYLAIWYHDAVGRFWIDGVEVAAVEP